MKHNMNMIFFQSYLCYGSSSPRPNFDVIGITMTKVALLLFKIVHSFNSA